MGQIVTDNFNRANAANLGANWTPWIDAVSRNKTPAILSNTASVQDDGNGDDAFTAYTGAAWTGGADHYAEMQLVKSLNASGTMGGPMARCTFGSTANTSRGYLALPAAIGVSSAAHQLWRVDDNAVFTALGSPFTATIASTDVIRVEAQGSTIRFVVNGSVLQTVTDTTYATGNPGLHLEFHSANDDTEADNWAAGDFGVIITVPTGALAIAGVAPTAVITVPPTQMVGLVKGQTGHVRPWPFQPGLGR